MKSVEVVQKTLDTISVDIALLFVYKDKQSKKPRFLSSDTFAQIDNSLGGELLKLCDVENFVGDLGSCVSFYTGTTVVPTKVVVMGLGKQSEFVLNDLRNILGKFISSHRNSIDSIAFAYPEQSAVSNEDFIQAVVETAELASYSFRKYKEKKKENRELSSLIFSFAERLDQKSAKEIIAKAQAYARATVLARDLVNEQPSVATPTFLAQVAKDIAKSNNEIKVTIYDKPQLEKMGMDAFLGIARASDTPPKFICLEYTPLKSTSKKKLALVGKGITFDSGGINVKPGDHMSDMKMDMAGAAIVLGVFSIIAEVSPSYPVMGIIAATPNMISGNAIVPGDVVRAMNGKTIEVLNTDAEGRVTLADSLSYAVKEGATEIIDFATLTGACLVALGEDIAGLFVNNRDFADRIKAAAHDAGEKVWELPLEKDYKSQNKSSVADIANIPSSRYGGTITAALFLQEFIGNTTWAHLDIAGPAFSNKGTSTSPKGGTGFGVRTVLQLLEGKNK
jgi:leucyl aminopeptidase